MHAPVEIIRARMGDVLMPCTPLLTPLSSDSLERPYNIS